MAGFIYTDTAFKNIGDSGFIIMPVLFFPYEMLFIRD